MHKFSPRPEPLHRHAAAPALCGLFLIAFVVAAVMAGPAAADEEDGGSHGLVTVFEVSGLLDPIMAGALEDAISAAESDGHRALVLQLDSKQAVVSDSRLEELADRFAQASVPIAVWVGPSGASAHGKVAQLVALADRVGVSIGSTIGATGDQVLDEQRYGRLWGDNEALLADTEINWIQAIDLGIVTCDLSEIDELGNELTAEQARERCANPTIGDFLISLDAVDTEVVDNDGEPRRRLLTSPRFTGPGLLDQLLHTVASPPIAYLLLVIGLGLLVFELYSIGIGIAGAVGAVMGALGAYGLAVLPYRTWALVLLVLSMVAFAVDVQTAVPRAWTLIGMAAFAIGTVFLYPQSDVSMSWIPMTVAIVGMAVVMGRGMPIMVRGRFATTHISRDFLIGRTGRVVEGDAAPEVEIDGAVWPCPSCAGLSPGNLVIVREASPEGLVVESAG